jgi:aldehyde:ferredoxin oxidoreductase
MINVLKDGIGFETTMTELMNAGERRINMMRWFNAQNGFDKRDDRLPKRLFEPLPEGPFKDKLFHEESFYEAVEQYYIYAGWNPETGNPTDDTLRRLSLSWLLDRGTSIC